MSYGSDYKERQRRQRRQDARALLYVLRTAITTAALVAIAFAFDVPERLRAKFWGEQPAVAERPAALQQASPPQGPQPAQSAANEPEPEQFDDPPRRPFDPPLQPEAPAAAHDEVVIPKRPAAAAPAPPVEPQPAEEPSFSALVLDLERKSIRLDLAEAPPVGTRLPRVRVLDLAECGSKIEMEPASGIMDGKGYVRFPEHVRVRILVRTRRIGTRVFLVVEPQMDIGFSRPVPLTLERISDELSKSRDDLAKRSAEVADTKAEVERLKAWVKPGTGPKLLADKQRAQKYIAETEPLFPQMDADLERGRQWIRELESLQNLADRLHNQAELRFEVVESN